MSNLLREPSQPAMPENESDVSIQYIYDAPTCRLSLEEGKFAFYIGPSGEELAVVYGEDLEVEVKHYSKTRNISIRQLMKFVEMISDV